MFLHTALAFSPGLGAIDAHLSSNSSTAVLIDVSDICVTVLDWFTAKPSKVSSTLASPQRKR
jgi:hypothetical protein